MRRRDLEPLIEQARALDLYSQPHHQWHPAHARARQTAAAARQRLKGMMEVLFVLPDYYSPGVSPGR